MGADDVGEGVVADGYAAGFFAHAHAEGSVREEAIYLFGYLGRTLRRNQEAIDSIFNCVAASYTVAGYYR